MDKDTPVKIPKQTRGKRHVLLAEDDGEMRSLLILWFRQAGWKVTEAKDGGELLEELNHVIRERKKCKFGLVVSDIRMPKVTGTKLLSWIAKVPGLPRFIFITSFGDPSTHEKAKRLGVVKIFDKPFEIEDLIAEANAIVDEPPS